MDACRRKPLSKQGELAVFGAEVVAPLADAVCLVDRESLHAHFSEQIKQPRVDEAFGGREEQPQFAGREPVADLPSLVC